LIKLAAPYGEFFQVQMEPLRLQLNSSLQVLLFLPLTFKQLAAPFYLAYCFHFTIAKERHPIP